MQDTLTHHNEGSNRTTNNKLIHRSKDDSKLETLTSRTWKRANGASTRDLGVHQLKDGSQNWQDNEKEPGKLSQWRLLTENTKQDSEKGICTAGRDTYIE